MKVLPKIVRVRKKTKDLKFDQGYKRAIRLQNKLHKTALDEKDKEILSLKKFIQDLERKIEESKEKFEFDLETKEKLFKAEVERTERLLSSMHEKQLEALKNANERIVEALKSEIKIKSHQLQILIQDLQNKIKEAENHRNNVNMFLSDIKLLLQNRQDEYKGILNKLARLADEENTISRIEKNLVQLMQSYKDEEQISLAETFLNTKAVEKSLRNKLFM